MILDFKRVISWLKTEAFNAARVVAVEAAIAEAEENALVNDPPSFVGYVIQEWNVEVNMEAEAESTIEIESAYAMDPDEV